MEFIKRNKKNILIAFLLILFISAFIIIFYLLNNPKEEIVKEITGKVIIADKDYLIMESNKENYLISNIKGSYEVGDKVKFNYLAKELNDTKNPREIKIIDEELIEREEQENNKQDIDKKEDSEIKPNNSNQNNTTSKTDSNTPNINEDLEKESGEELVLNYISDLEEEMAKPTLGESAKKGFVTVVDFLFYDGTIKGYKFKELTNSAKLKVLAGALYFDSKIEKYFPGYKESISNTSKKIYTNVKEQATNIYLDITTTICANNNELCTSAKEDFKILKKNFGLTFDLIKDLAGDGITKLKNWYEIWRDN